MPKEKKDRIIGQEKKFVAIGYKYHGRKKGYKIVDNHFGAARKTIHIQLPISKYG